MMTMNPIRWPGLDSKFNCYDFRGSMGVEDRHLFPDMPQQPLHRLPGFHRPLQRGQHVAEVLDLLGRRIGVDDLGERAKVEQGAVWVHYSLHQSMGGGYRFGRGG
ncbi:hypothetical protein GAY33_17300 [Azospirillum brasilense]|uniref:hypothetical protein n=1 Tax=Azospirillum argentinense TaxID=2970906 RepID=UPI00190EA3B1|nr:hypothetical protein [Azospirillum argentinense]MBK3800962.1 hypothetical protein [Azospirillum argentinense]